MKRIFRCILTTFFLFGSVLHAQIEEGSLGSEKLMEVDSESPKIFRLVLYGDAIGPAKIDRHHFDHQRLKYTEVGGELFAGFYYEPEFEEAAYASIGYEYIKFDWRHNIFFRQQHFNMLSMSLGGFTERLCNWHWQGQLRMNVSLDHFNVSEYATYDLLVWGRYNYSCNIGVHLGFYAETGMKIDRVYPVIGFDWKINNKWTLNCVFPVNISLVYQMRNNLAASLAVRFFEQRLRVGKHEPLPKGLLVYRNTGIEFALTQECNSWMTANIHAGYTLGGTFKVANQHYKHRVHFDVKGAPYFGAELTLKF